jgi:hypothetical protein
MKSTPWGEQNMSPSGSKYATTIASTCPRILLKRFVVSGRDGLGIAAILNLEFLALDFDYLAVGLISLRRGFDSFAVGLEILAPGRINKEPTLKYGH